jgi:probable rRNA maturation factor
MKVTVGFVNEQKDMPIGANEKKIIREAINETLLMEEFDRTCEVSVAVVDEAKIRALNATYREVDAVTDVLSFPDGSTDLDTGVVLLGDVVLCARRAKEQADNFGHSFERELGYLTCHSVLHLLGYDHVDSEADEKIMRNKQTEVMRRMGLEVVSGD